MNESDIALDAFIKYGNKEEILVFVKPIFDTEKGFINFCSARKKDNPILAQIYEEAKKKEEVVWG